MTYLEWFNAHAKKHKHILQKLENRTDEEVIAYFRWENMLKNEPDFCPLFARKEKCHDMERLNCYLCACPEFRFDDHADIRKSWCVIDARKSRKIEVEKSVHLDCSGCILPHTEGYIKKHFDRNWRKIMHKAPFKD
jgi:hypothetical protein